MELREIDSLYILASMVKSLASRGNSISCDEHEVDEEGIKSKTCSIKYSLVMADPTPKPTVHVCAFVKTEMDAFTPR